jgi:TRAP-type mannitol/chloroaromatic compound transport system substrate-binding protein
LFTFGCTGTKYFLLKPVGVKKSTGISRKNFIHQSAKVLSYSALGMAGLSSCKAEAEEEIKNNFTKRYHWNMVTTWPPNFPIIGEAIQEFCQKVYQLSHGQIKIKVYHAGELIPAFEVFDAVSSGAAEMGNSASYYWAGKSSGAQFFSSVPFGMNAQQLQSWLQFGGGMELWRDLYASFNLVPFYAGNTGVQMGGWFNKKVFLPSDLKGLKMRIPGLGGKVFERAGGTVVLSSGGELYTHLERGIVDAAEWIGPYHDYLMGFHEIAKYYYSPGWHEPGTAFEFIVNKRIFDQLPSHLQEMLEWVSSAISAKVLSHFEAKNAEYLLKIKSESKVSLEVFSEEILVHLKERSLEVIQEMAEESKLNKKIYDSYYGFLAQSQAWASLSEKSYHSKIASFSERIK